MAVSKVPAVGAHPATRVKAGTMFDVLTKPNPKELERLQLFKAVPPESIEGILASCVIRRLKKGEVLLAPGESNHYLYQLLSGRLSVHLE